MTGTVGMLQTAAIGLGLMAAMMTALWAWHLRLKNAALVDVGWAAGLGLLAALSAGLGDAPAHRRILVAALGCLWAFRLASHLWRDRVAGGTPEEGRYVYLRAHWGRHANLHFLWFFLAQGIGNVLLALPFLLAAFNPAPGVSPFEMAAAALWIASVGGEALADAQLRAFKAVPANKGKVCRAGLWSVSRHPNYFCEWLTWMAFALLAVSAPYGWLGLISPAVILFLLVKVTGIPPTESQSLRSRGEAYARYQAEVSAFFPWFPRRPRAAGAATRPARSP